MKKWFFIIVICLGILFTAAGCGPQKYTAQEARTLWHDTWYAEGRNATLQEAQSIINNAMDKVAAKAYQDGKAAGIKEGKEQGYSEGVSASRQFNQWILPNPIIPRSDGCCTPGLGFRGDNIPLNWKSDFPDVNSHFPINIP